MTVDYSDDRGADRGGADALCRPRPDGLAMGR
jgi:hypothetical protein